MKLGELLSIVTNPHQTIILYGRSKADDGTCEMRLLESDSGSRIWTKFNNYMVADIRAYDDDLCITIEFEED